MTPDASAALAAAQKLAGDGLWCFPCALNKTPTCKWKDLASDDPRELRALWVAHPGPLIGVMTGERSGIDALDIDKKHPEAISWWLQHRPRLLPTRTHRTRSGGLHLLFRHRAGVRNTASQIARGIDTRGDGGYIIWWPAEGFEVARPDTYAQWPAWLTEALAPPPKPIPVPVDLRLDRQRDLRPTLHRALGILRTVALAGEGERNRVLFWGACRIREMEATGEIDRPAEAELLDNLHEAALRAGLTHPEIVRTIKSATRAAA